MDSATTTAAGELPIIFQATAIDGETKVMRNIWLIIKPTPQEGIFEAFNDMGLPADKERFGSALLGASSIFVKSSLYVVGGGKPNSDELSSCIRYLDTDKFFEGWKVRTLPSSSFDSVLGVYDDSIYILPGMWKYGYYGMDEDRYCTTQRGYIWNTIGNECRQIRIPPPGGERQWRRIRACASLDKEGLLIAMDGEKTNFFLYNPENNDWKIYPSEDPLPKFIGETSFAASNGRLYILEVRGKPPAFLYIYDIEKRKLVMDKKPIPKFDDDLWLMDKWDRVVRLVPVADDKLCFLWLGPVTYENENMWPPVRILHYLKVKFSINPNPFKSEVKVEGDRGFHTNITNLLDCLPCGDPEQFEAKLGGRSPLYLQLDVFQKQQEDNSSAEEIETSLISGEPFQDQAEDIASPKEKGKGKRKRTQLVDPLSRPEQKRAKRKVEPVNMPLENKRLRHENASLLARIDKLKQRLAKRKREHQEKIELLESDRSAKDATLQGLYERYIRLQEDRLQVYTYGKQVQSEVPFSPTQLRPLSLPLYSSTQLPPYSLPPYSSTQLLQRVDSDTYGKQVQSEASFPSEVSFPQHETGALAAFPQFKQETGASAAFPQFKQETGASAAFPQFKQGIGAVAPFPQFKLISKREQSEQKLKQLEHKRGQSEQELKRLEHTTGTLEDVVRAEQLKELERLRAEQLKLELKRGREQLEQMREQSEQMREQSEQIREQSEQIREQLERELKQIEQMRE